MSDAQPTDCEREVWNQVNAVLQESESILSGLQAYKGAGHEIRDVRLINSSALIYGSISCIIFLKPDYII